MTKRRDPHHEARQAWRKFLATISADVDEGWRRFWASRGGPPPIRDNFTTKTPKASQIARKTPQIGHEDRPDGGVKRSP